MPQRRARCAAPLPPSLSLPPSLPLPPDRRLVHVHFKVLRAVLLSGKEVFALSKVDTMNCCTVRGLDPVLQSRPNGIFIVNHQDDRRGGRTSRLSLNVFPGLLLPLGSCCFQSIVGSMVRNFSQSRGDRRSACCCTPAPYRRCAAAPVPATSTAMMSTAEGPNKGRDESAILVWVL